MSESTLSSQPSLAARTARGVAWTTAPAILAKLTGFVADIALAWFLTREDFGAVGLAVAVAALFSTIQQAGLRDILTQRQKKFGKWATPAFWMAISLGVVCTALMAASAPLAAWLFDSPTLKGLVALLSIRIFIDAFAIVPQAQLQSQLRYRAIGAVAAVTTLIQAGLSVLLASRLFDWGPYAMAAPMVLTSLVQASAFWYLAKPSIHAEIQLPRWRWLGRDAGFAVATGLVTIAIGYGDNAVLGIFRDQEIVGVYFFAYRLAVQANQILATNLGGVLFAALSQLQHDPQRQRAATLSAVRLLSILGMPLNCLQAAVAAPFFHLAYGAKWDAAVVPFQLLSVGMALALIGAPIASLLRAQGRFRTYFICTLCFSLLYLAMISTGAAIGGAAWLAGAVACFYLIFSSWGLRIALGKYPGYWTFMLRGSGLSLVFAILSVAAAIKIGAMFGPNVVRIVVIGSVASILYAVLVRVFQADAYHELLARFRAIRAPRPATPPVAQPT